ncbi:MAG: hypothetical protein ABIP65_07405 [Vicinamibacterales bacterium]
MTSIYRVLTAVRHFPVSRRTLLRLFATGMLVVGAAGATAVEAGAQQPRSVQRVQATPPAEGSRGWAQDNCFYIFQSGQWRSADLCRVMRGRAIYDTYTPSTRRWGLRFDESEAGWTGLLDLNGGNPNAWFKFSNDGRTILVFDGRQWFNYTAAVAAQAQGQSQAQAEAAAIIARNKANPALQAQIAQAQGMIAASQSRQAGVWTAPNCTASYNGCR